MKSAYKLALERLAQTRKNNTDENANRRAAVYSRVPRVREIERELMESGADLARCVLRRDNDFEHIKQRITALQAERDSLLTQSGYPIRHLDEIFDCPSCRDTGFIEDKKCKCLARLIAEMSAQNSNLTKIMRMQTFENFDYSLFADNLADMRTIVQMAEKFTANFVERRGNLFIFGNVGSGKTYLSSCIANRALESGKTVYYQSAYRIFDMIQRSKFEEKDNSDLKALMEFVYSVDLLIIDDLGTEFVTTLSTSSIFDIINSRLSSEKSTIINTNLSPSEVGQMYSERVASRIVGEYEIIHLENRDLRVK